MGALVYGRGVNQGRFGLGVVAGVLFLVGCAKLPDYAAPKASTSQRSEIDLSDVKGYGPLTRADFRGEKAPFASDEDAKKLGAQVCAHILPPREMEILVTFTQPEKGPATYAAKLKDPPHYVAVMNRKCSWWNPRSTNPEDYQLEHEQIHFALAEIAARRLNASAREILHRIHATGSSEAEVGASVKEQVNQVLRDATAELVERNRAFDLDTSLQIDRKKQTEWRRTAESELEALKEHAVPYVPAEAAP
jgi:hypothetical protein